MLTVKKSVNMEHMKNAAVYERKQCYESKVYFITLNFI